MPRIKDVSKRIPFRYSTYQIRKDIVNNFIYIISFGESIKEDRRVYIINEKAEFSIFRPYDGLDLPENIMLESGKDLYDCFNFMFNNIKEDNEFKNIKAILKKNKKFGCFIYFIDKNNNEIRLRADGKFVANDKRGFEFDTNIKEDSLFNLINCKEFYNPFAYLGFD